MIVVQIVLLEKCFEIEHSTSLVENEESIKYYSIDKLNSVLSKIFSSFIIYFFIFIFYKSEMLTTVTGSLSAICEACLPLPQFISNFKNKSVESVRFANQFRHDIHVGFWGYLQICFLYY